MAQINATGAQLQALEVFKDMIANAATRAQYATAANAQAKQAVFDAQGVPNVNYQDIPGAARQHLEGLNAGQLQILSQVNDAFTAAGLSVQTSPGLLMVY